MVTMPALMWEEKRKLYREVIRRLEVARGPDAFLERDICLALDRPGIRWTYDLEAVEDQVRRSFPFGGWAVQDEPHVDARIWSDNPVEAECEYVDHAWRRPADAPHMPEPPATKAIALTLAYLRSMEEMF